MKTRVVLSVIISFSIALTACRDKNSFTISGKVEHPGKIKTAFLLKTDSTQSGSMTIIDSVALTDGEFSFKRNVADPQFYEVLLGSFPINLIARNGEDINIKIEGKDTTGAYEIYGSEDSEKMRTYNKIMAGYSKVTKTINDEFSAKYKTAKNKADSDALIAFYYPRFEKNMDASSAEVLKFMNENETSLAAFYASQALDRFKYEQQLVAYADFVKGKFPGNATVNFFVKTMMEIKPISVGHVAPDFTLIDSDNKLVKLSDYKGKYIMLDFWASWCAPCRKENPNVVKLYAKFKDKGLNILSISLDVERKPWLEAVAADKLTWRHASEFQRFDGPVEKLYKIEAIPSNFIIDPKGIIVAKNITGKQLEDFFNKTFSK
ncbi:AhpC/TSA family protein [Mucilaginibacter sp. HMF5004]|uniref:TlpA disulfide reductase family protein n=1 Tax=Mucilaginibacter rivuli TaxID=2857527 RepID=UPI001C5F9985|nr:TlpA disulfide reductase family protein [Mucilaginibacter rivuli]MBW4891549.1 AhpC/TSA family protein [Mucilaginibacter rivuli]